MTRPKNDLHGLWMRLSSPKALHKRMRAHAKASGVKIPEAYRRALRWGLLHDAHGVLLEGGKAVRVDVVLTPSLKRDADAVCAESNKTLHRLVLQTASAWCLHMDRPEWLREQTPCTAGRGSTASAYDALTKPPTLLEALRSLPQPTTCARLSAETQLPVERTFAMLCSLERVGAVAIRQHGQTIVVERQRAL